MLCINFISNQNKKRFEFLKYSLVKACLIIFIFAFEINYLPIHSSKKSDNMENSIFSQETTAEIISRIKKLTPQTQAIWGKMTVDQMLAHCNVSYEMVYDNIHPKPNPVMKFILKTMVKNKVVSTVPYKQNSPTAPQFIMKGSRDFDKEKNRLIDYINRTQQLGADYFDGKESHSFGKLTAAEWNNMFYKHLNHHLSQFGV